MIKNNFKKITIKLASFSKILSWSFGEVCNSNYINFKNLKPEKKGLFCLSIFSNFNLCCEKKKCFCNKNNKFLNLKRAHLNYRMGHFIFCYPLIHIWFIKSTPNGISNLINLSYKIIFKIINFKIKIVVKSFLKKIKKFHLYLFDTKISSKIFTLSGNKAIKKLLSDDELFLDCILIKKKILNCESYYKLFFFLHQINKIYIFYLSGNKPKWMIISAIPVAPPRMRPLVPLSIGKYASSDLNELYKKIIDRNCRLQKMMIIGAPKNILINERVLLQESLNALFDNEKLSSPILSPSKRILKSFSSSIKGKYGRFRQNLLGKRVDFSARTVISVEPSLFLYQCAIPIEICLELFKPFIFFELKKKKKINTLSFIDDFYKRNKKFVINCLLKIIKNRTILLNRAPTLHRMGFQSFKILLTQDKTIKLHPLVCLSYNADFDGDQMAIHLPLTINSLNESNLLLLSINNILSPSNGEPIIIPTQDIIMGLYFLTYNYNFNLNNKIFSINDIILFFNYNNFNFQLNIYFQYKKKNIKTNIGRVLFFNILNNNIDFLFINKTIKKKSMSYIIKYMYEFYNFKKLIIILDKLKKIGFLISTFSGITICYDDLKEIKNKYFLQKIINKLIYKNNIFKIIDLFEKIFLNLILKNICIKKKNKKFLNNLFLMMDSGSRGSMLQIKQLIGFRGFFSKSNGDIINEPILENLKNGLSMKSFFISTFGARKGLTDTSLKTANSGYLTRKLIDALHDLVIYKINCMTKSGIEIFIFNFKKIILLYRKIFGRIILKNIIYNNKILISKNVIIDNKILFLLIKKKIKKIRLRSPLHCISSRGICSFCYGIDLSTNKLILIGIPIGIIAAQSIGEPGTQLTMRTFHTGGVASYFYSNDDFITIFSGFIKISNCKCVLNKINKLIILSLNSVFSIKKNKIIEKYKFSYGTKINYRNGDFIKQNIKIVDFEKDFCIYSENYGIVYYETFNLKREYNIFDKKYYFQTLNYCNIYIKFKKKKKYCIPKNFSIIIKNHDFIFPGDTIAKISNVNVIKSSIIGGLPRLSELFESRTPKKKAIISEIDGIVSIKNNNKNYIIKIISKFGFFKIYFLNFLRKIYINNGDYVRIGDILSDGKLDLNDIISLIGLDVLLDFFINEVNNIYLPQNIFINEKHLELVLKQMTKKIKIIYSGDCFFQKYNILYLEDILTENLNTLKNSKKISFFKRIVTGITKSSLESLSFFSAASFQETNKILVDSAIRNRIDYLLGLKENVVVGKLIPAGTGLINFYHEFKKKSKNKHDIFKRKNLKLYLYN